MLFNVYDFISGCTWLKCLWVLNRKLFIFGSNPRVICPLEFLTFLNGTIFWFFTYPALNFSKATLSSSFKKFSTTNSALSYGTSKSFLINISRIIILFLRCLSSYLLNCPFLAMGGMGIPGWSHSKISFNHSKSEYLLYTVLPKMGVLI